MFVLGIGQTQEGHAPAALEAPGAPVLAARALGLAETHRMLWPPPWRLLEENWVHGLKIAPLPLGRLYLEDGPGEPSREPGQGTEDICVTWLQRGFRTFCPLE